MTQRIRKSSAKSGEKKARQSEREESAAKIMAKAAARNMKASAKENHQKYKIYGVMKNKYHRNRVIAWRRNQSANKRMARALRRRISSSGISKIKRS